MVIFASQLYKDKEGNLVTPLFIEFYILDSMKENHHATSMSLNINGIWTFAKKKLDFPSVSFITNLIAKQRMTEKIS